MTFQNLESVLDESAAIFSGCIPLEALSAGRYAAMRWPKLLPLMRFSVRRYAAADYGNILAMYTKGMGGMMQLATFVCTPNCGTDVPLLLIDVMAMAKKRAAFVEYYDLTGESVNCPALESVASRFAQLPDYNEKPAWYVSERTPYSLIKGGEDDAALCSMLADSVAAYAETCASRQEPCPENRERLQAFINRMVAEGNPSSAAMERVLGRAGAEAFFRAAVMPAQYTAENF